MVRVLVGYATRAGSTAEVAGIIADELGNAVVARGADTNRKRSSYYDLHIQVIDIALLVIEYALFATMVLAKIGVGVL